MALEVSGKTAIITGAGSGINLAFAQLLLSKNCNVVFADISLQQEAKDTLQQYSPDTKPSVNGAVHSARAVFQPTDVTDWTQLTNLIATTEERFGHADIICPGAGVYEPLFSNFWIPPGTAPSRDTIDSHRYTSVDINITHPIRMTQLAISHFLKHNIPGVVVHISSVAAQRPHIQCPIYVASKHAISGFVRSLTPLEFPQDKRLPKIRVNAVAPGVVKTPLWTQNREKLKWVDESMDEWVTPDEVADVMLDCVTMEKYVGGSVIEVGKRQTRFVKELNDPGPHGAGYTVSNIGSGEQEVWARLGQPGWGQLSN